MSWFRMVHTIMVKRNPNPPSAIPFTVIAVNHDYTYIKHVTRAG